jgi:hypothetical protein
MGLLKWGVLSDERTGLSFTAGAGPRQCSHSWVRIPWHSLSYLTFSASRLPQRGGSGLRIYMPQKQGSPVTPPGVGFPFRRALRLAGLGGRYSNQPPNRRQRTDIIVIVCLQLLSNSCLFSLSYFRFLSLCCNVLRNRMGVCGLV